MAKRTHECKAPHCEGGVSFETFGECEICEGTGAVAADSPHAGRALVKDDGIYDEDGLRIGTEEPKAPQSPARVLAATEWRALAKSVNRSFWLGQPGVTEERDPPAGGESLDVPGRPERYVIAADRIWTGKGLDAGTSRPRTPELEAQVRQIAAGVA